jgi:O-antigen/teichoic acid export membrane protein
VSDPGHDDRAPAGVQGSWHDYWAIVGAQGLGIALGATGVLLATQLLGPGGYGTLALLVAAVQCLYCVGVNGTMTAAIRFGRDQLVAEGSAGRAIWPWLGLVAGSVILTLALSTLGLSYLGKLAELERVPGVVLAILFLATVGAKIVEQLLQALGRMRVFAFCRPLAKAVLCLGLAWLLFSGGRWQAADVLALMALGLAIQGIVGLVFVSPSRLLRPVALDLELAGRIALYSAPLLLRSAGGYFLDWIDVWMIGLFRGVREIGIYQVANQAALVTSELLAAIPTIILPLLVAWRASGSNERARLYLDRIVPQLAVCWCLLTPAVGLVGILAFPALLGGGFAESSSRFAILLAGVGFHCLAYLYLPVFFGYDLVGRATGILLLSAAANLTLDILLVPHWGGIGASVGTASSYALGASLYVRFGNRRLGLHRGAALVPPLLAAPALVTQAWTQSLGLQLAAAAACWVATIWWARRSGVFRPADLSYLDAVALPRPARRGLRFVYKTLSPRPNHRRAR